MTESDFILAVDDLWEGHALNADTVRSLVVEGLTAWPDSHDLLLRLGWILQLDVLDGKPDASPFGTIADLHEHVVRLHPSSAEAWTELGIKHDINANYIRAEECLRTAIALGADADAYSHLARVLAQSHRKSEALAVIAEGACPFAAHPDVVAMRQELEADDWSDADAG